MDTNAAFGYFHDPGDRFIFHSLQVPEHDGCPLLTRKFGDELFYNPGQFLFLDPGLLPCFRFTPGLW